jgi:glutamate N-acetyltransferase/amino-acid N-acetyltransferase
MTPSLPLGYRVAGVHCGIKRNPAKQDLALFVSDSPATAAGVYTQNLVFGAPVGWNRAITPASDVRIVVVNSGNSNACTGERGDRDAAEMARLAGETVGAKPRQSLVMSTGIIGSFLPMEKIAAGIRSAAEKLATDETAVVSAARGMMTTDTQHKLSGRTLELKGTTVRICGMAKGAAMIGPNMATMLSVILTDATLSPDAAQQILRAAVSKSFNCISVEGHMSTSDTVLLLANGAAKAGPSNDKELASLSGGVQEVATDLARAIVADGEGASHFITIDVAGCATWNDARQIARTIADSPLVKTAIAGADPNWGRVVSAVGYSGVKFNPRGLSMKLNGATLYQNGGPVEFDAAAASNSIRSNRHTQIEVTLSEGTASCRFWTTDLTAEYVRLNADYHT